MRRRKTWARLTVDAWALGFEASAVIGLRTIRLAAGGPAAEAEAQRMVAEKVQAGIELQQRALTGGLGLSPAAAAANTLAHYRRKVRSNRIRLSK